MTAKVLQSIAQRAAKFCRAHDAQIHVVDGAVLRCVADYGDLPASAGRELIPINGGFVAGELYAQESLSTFATFQGRRDRNAPEEHRTAISRY